MLFRKRNHSLNYSSVFILLWFLALSEHRFHFSDFLQVGKHVEGQEVLLELSQSFKQLSFKATQRISKSVSKWDCIISFLRKFKNTICQNLFQKWFGLVSNAGSSQVTLTIVICVVTDICCCVSCCQRVLSILPLCSSVDSTVLFLLSDRVYSEPDVVGNGFAQCLEGKQWYRHILIHQTASKDQTSAVYRNMTF